MILDIILDVVLDTLKLLPFLYVTYLVMEYLEEKAEDKMVHTLRKYEKAGPFIGGALGIIPQCGFSASAASLYSGGIITGGTLIAIFLSTSDEMLPIMLSETVALSRIISILMTKFVFAVIFGLLIDLLHRRQHKAAAAHDFHELCEREDCHCEEGNIWKSALIHTLHVAVFIFIISLGFAFLMEMMGQDRLSLLIEEAPVIGAFFSGIIGLIPNCAASVMITELFLSGIISSGQLIAGLMVGAGVGLLVLFRTNSNMRENIRMLLLLYICGVAAGLIIDALGIVY